MYSAKSISISSLEMCIRDRTGNAKFSLVYSQGCGDQIGGDFFENLGASNESTPSEALEPEPISTPTPDYDKVTADVEWPVEKPKVDAYGYPLSGEYVHSDDENGLWFYACLLYTSDYSIFRPAQLTHQFSVHVIHGGCLC